MTIIKGNEKDTMTATYYIDTTIDDSFDIKGLRLLVDNAIAEKKEFLSIEINSLGGSVFLSTQIGAIIKSFKGKKIAHISSVAASAATYICCCCDEVIIDEDAYFMIHQPIVNSVGNIKTLESDLKLLRDISENYLSVYSSKTGKTKEEIETLWEDRDFWMSAKEAKEMGFVDKIKSRNMAIKKEALHSVDNKDISGINYQLPDFLSKKFNCLINNKKMEEPEEVIYKELDYDKVVEMVVKNKDFHQNLLEYTIGEEIKNPIVISSEIENKGEEKSPNFWSYKDFVEQGKVVRDLERKDYKKWKELYINSISNEFENIKNK